MPLWSFASALWPSLVATLVGIICGLPIALWLNRRFVAHAQHVSEEGQRAELTDALAVLTDALALNIPRLDEVGSAVAADLYTYYTELDTATWDSVRDTIASLLHDPELLGRLAYHFSRVSAVDSLNARWTDSVDEDLNRSRKVMSRADIVRLVDDVKAEAELLRSGVEKCRSAWARVRIHVLSRGVLSRISPVDASSHYHHASRWKQMRFVTLTLPLARPGALSGFLTQF